VADVNLDGRPDLVVASFGERTVAVLVGNGNGTFQPRVDYPIGGRPRAVAIGDVNGDGRPDLVVVDPEAAAVHVLLGNRDGGFRASPTFRPARSRSRSRSPT
jgi:hypothetical protein